MPLHYSFVENGLLNQSNPLPRSIAGACRAVAFNHDLYCTYRSETPPSTVRYARLTPKGRLSEAHAIWVEELPGDPAIFTFKGKLYLLSSGDEEGDDYTIAPRLVTIDQGVVTTSNFTIDLRGTPAVVEYRGALDTLQTST